MMIMIKTINQTMISSFTNMATYNNSNNNIIEYVIVMDDATQEYHQEEREYKEKYKTEQTETKLKVTKEVETN